MADFFEFLTSEDKRRLLDIAELRSIDPDGVIVNQGELQDAIFVLEDGEARVERSHKTGWAVESVRRLAERLESGRSSHF